MTATELKRLVDGLGQRLRRNVTVDDPRLRQLAFSSHEYGAIDRLREQSIFKREVPREVADWIRSAGGKTATGPFRPPVNPEIGATTQRLGLPIRQRGVLLGFVWILEGDDPLTEAEIQTVLDTIDTIAVVIQRDQLAHQLHRSRARELLRDLVAHDDQATREQAAADLVDADLFAAGEPVVALVVTLHPDDRALLDGERDTLADCLERVSGRLSDRRHASLVRRNHGLLLLSTRDPLVSGDAKLGLAEELLDALARGFPGARPMAGFGDVAETLTGFHRSYGQAERAARVARTVEGLGPVARFDRLGVYGLLARIPREELTLDALPPGLLRLLDVGAKGEQLASTLEAYLDHAGDVQATAEKLFVHRTTLYYRLQRIEGITGAQLTNGEDRLTFHIGLKIARLVGLRHD
ncbi:PucR family transcriptional regulator [Rhizohabitans arisaemae]|uniref:PucR family transcriptional regulator n=1 Tax=Rhizohabitans arisaemae TaxID=2720610 RepID=UPI0024B1ED03|nr:helix-turn-helix domain-containing protein [Rhizohabitans arisaemae]